MNDTQITNIKFFAAFTLAFTLLSATAMYAQNITSKHQFNSGILFTKSLSNFAKY